MSRAGAIIRLGRHRAGAKYVVAMLAWHRNNEKRRAVAAFFCSMKTRRGQRWLPSIREIAKSALVHPDIAETAAGKRCRLSRAHDAGDYRRC